MIIRETKVSVTPTPREIEYEIWSMNTVMQIDLILAMVQRYRNQIGDVCMQLEYLSEDLPKLLSAEEKRAAVQLFENILKYLKGDDNE